MSSEWGTPNMIENGLDPQLLTSRQYGHRLHIWDLRRRRHQQVLDLGDAHQLALELRPAHDPTKTHGFVNVTVSVEDLSSSVWTWSRPNGRWAVEKVASIPPEPAETGQLPPALQPFGAVPPLVTDHVLTLDDRLLLVSCWGTGELRATTCPIRSTPGRPAACGSVGSSIGRRTRRRPTAR